MLAALGTAGCENKHIGRTCDLDVDGGVDGGSATQATINPEALECPSRICLLPAAQTTTDTTAFCTAGCSSDDDCSDGETGPKGSQTDHRCETGFACVVATVAGPFCCQKFCVCKDFTGPPPSGGFPFPADCIPHTGSTCQNVAQ
jgi:hypothetical protein